MGFNNSIDNLIDFKPIKRFIVGEMKTTPRNDPNKGHKIKITPLGLREIPDAMRYMGWHLAADLMDRWFNGTKQGADDHLEISPELKQGYSLVKNHEKIDIDYRNVQKGFVCTDLLKMDYAIKWPKIKNAMISLIGNKDPKFSWDDHAAMKVFGQKLHRNGWDRKSTFDLKMTDKDVLTVDYLAQVNIAKFGETLDTLDDLYGAIGKALMKVAVDGVAYVENGVPKFKTRNLGFYIRDEYDFEGVQPLGVWTKKGVLGKWGMAKEAAKEAAEKFTVDTVVPPRFRHIDLDDEAIIAIKHPETHAKLVEAIDWSKGEPFAEIWNSDFCEWRKKHNKGHDFITFSDVLWLPYNRIIKPIFESNENKIHPNYNKTMKLE